MPSKCQLLLVTGVSGSGKTTVGRLAAAEFGWAFHDADDYHPPANVAKMSAGIPLDDEDRAPWLAAIRAAIEANLATGKGAVFACSALKQSYRKTLCGGLEAVGLVFLRGDRETLMARMQSRDGHFMKPEMLDSQLAVLEEPPPGEAIRIDIRMPETEIIRTIRTHFRI